MLLSNWKRIGSANRSANALELAAHLLDRAPGLIASPGDLNACLNARGLYNSFQFVLRLSPEVHRKMATLPNGIVTGGIDFEGKQAFSTYLHETIHWWQHVGSTIGLMLSLSYPAQAHANFKHLKDLLASIGPKKSLLRVAEKAISPGGDPTTPAGLLNVVVNNHFDIEFFRILATVPEFAQQAVDHNLFDCIGHSYHTAYGNILAVLTSTLEESSGVLPDPRPWPKAFSALRAQKETGYYYGSDIRLSPIGARDIFEGQARFGQLQYLYFASGEKLTWDDVRSLGMLGRVYGLAFEAFLQLVNQDWPPSIDHPVVALFLLICDMAINPAAGFPMPLLSFATFIEDVDPGIRFLFLCRAIATHFPEVAGAITNYSRDEYIQISSTLASHLLIDSPATIGETVSRWVDRSKEVRSLMEEHRSFQYAPRNLPIRVLLSHFISFSMDKYTKPEFFCWPGVWMTGERVSPQIGDLFNRHSALFLDKEDDDGVFPRLPGDRNEEALYEMFNTFYAANLVYDLTRQWISQPGPFLCDFRWLSSSGTQADLKAFGDRNFEINYGIHPDTFEIV